MSKPENSFITGLHKHLPVALHHEKMHNPYRGGTADVWYSGCRDLWVEYKFIVVPVRITTPIKIDLSALQLQWLRRRHEEGRNVAVIIGSKMGGVVFDNLLWETPIHTGTFIASTLSRKDLAAWILQQTGGPP